MQAAGDPYEIVRRFFVDGPPASRNVAFEAYQDPRFARAVRIYHYLASVRDHLLELAAGDEDFSVDVVEEEARVALRVRYRRGQLRRTAYLKKEEWSLLREEPRLRGILPTLDERR